ncbi:hypothetical protein BGZ54_001626, partial [Gamsiella multidivaricata]
MSAVKYLYKYVTKGPERANMTVALDNGDAPQDVNETNEFRDSRYVSACEAPLEDILLPTPR